MDVKIYDFNKRFGTTHKRAGIDEYISYALSKNADTIAVISSGNLLMELKDAIKRSGRKLNLINLINESCRRSQGAITMENGRILRDAGEREEYIAKFGKQSGMNYGKVVDVTDFIPKAYGEESEKILKSNPDYVSVPIGSGKNFISIYRKIKEKGLATKLVGFVPKGANGVFTNSLYEEDGNLFFRKMPSKSIADKLVTPYVYGDFKKEIFEAINSGHIVHELTPAEERKAVRESKHYDVKTEPSSSTAFYIVNKRLIKERGIKDDSNIVIVNTGKGSKEYNVVSVPISPIKKISSAAAIGIVTAGLSFLLTMHPGKSHIDSELEKEFFNTYYPGLLSHGHIPPVGPSLLDMIADKENAFVHGDTSHLIYLSKEEAEELVRKGAKARKKFS
jgi:hypothetical protein